MTPARLEQILSDWWQSHVANSVVSRSTEIHNYLQPKFEVLKKSLHDELSAVESRFKKPAPPPPEPTTSDKS